MHCNVLEVSCEVSFQVMITEGKITTVGQALNKPIERYGRIKVPLGRALVVGPYQTKPLSYCTVSMLLESRVLVPLDRLKK